VLLQLVQQIIRDRDSSATGGRLRILQEQLTVAQLGLVLDHCHEPQGHVDVAPGQRCQLAESQAREGGQQRHHPEPRRQSVDHPQYLIDRQHRTLGALVIACPRNAARVPLDHAVV
jgi:hypothetical protein